MSEEPKNPMWVALLSGAVILGTGPLALGALVGLGSRDDEGGFSGLAELVNEGGSFSYAILFAGAFASLVSAIVAAVSVRRPGLPAPFALIPFLLPVIAALVGVVLGMKDVMMAIATVSPSDKGVILVAATGELTSLSVQALAFAAAGTSCVAFAALVAIGAAPRGARLLTILGAGTLGLCLTVMTAQELAVRGGFRAIAHVAPSDRMVLLAGVIQEWQDLNRISNGLFLASLAVALVGGAVLAARSQKTVGIGTAAALIVAAIGFRGLNSMVERQLSNTSNVPAATQLRLVNGIEPSREDSVDLLDQTTERVDEAVTMRLSRHDMRDEPRWLGVELTPSLEPKTLRRVLQVVHLANAAGVELIGDGPRRQLETPAFFASAVALMSQRQLAAPMRVLFTGDECTPCVAATLSKTGLQAGEESWTQGEEAFAGDLATLPGVEVGFDEDFEALVRASLAALSHRHLLVVRVPMPNPMPRLPD